MAVMATALLMATGSSATAEAANNTRTFSVGESTFLLDGKPIRIMAGEVHYERIPREYWEHRIQMCKAQGFNALCIYTFWNAIEQQPGEFDFTGQHDVAAFVRLAQKHGMLVIVRPGPYCCAEWEMGGLPWWLLSVTNEQLGLAPNAEGTQGPIRLRKLDPRFMAAVGRYERALAKQLTPLTVQNGGPIIMVQVENEYGSYGTDKPYVSAVRDSLRAAGWEGTQMFQCDWSSNFEQNGLDDLVWTMNFGTNANVLKEFRRLKELRPTSPLMCSEYWSGWFDGWGRAHETRPGEVMVKGIETMLNNGISFSLYMAHGGTSFGQWAGSNTPGYRPDCTSYDYDAPIDEQGAATDKFYQLREVLSHFDDYGMPMPEGKTRKLPAVPKQKSIISIPSFELNEFAPLLISNKTEKNYDLKTMEQFGMGWGTIRYSTTLPRMPWTSTIRLTEPHDYALIYINEKLVGTIYRGAGHNAIDLPAFPDGGKLDIVVEAMGRINYGQTINDRKGITERVELITRNDEGHILTYNLKNWTTDLYPVDYDYAASRTYEPINKEQDHLGYYRGTFKTNKIGDTYLDLGQWGKGMVWVNGHAVGRFWQVGPQQTLFVPGCWLKKGVNEVIVLDLVGPNAQIQASEAIPTIEGLDHPVIDQLKKDPLPSKAYQLKSSDKPRPKVKEVGNDAGPGA